MKHFDPRELPEWLQLEVRQIEDARRRQSRGRLLIAIAAGLLTVAILWSFGAYDDLWASTAMEQNR